MKDQTLVICSDQHLVSKIYSSYNCSSGCDRKLQVSYELYHKEDVREFFSNLIQSSVNGMPSEKSEAVQRVPQRCLHVQHALVQEFRCRYLSDVLVNGLWPALCGSLEKVDCRRANNSIPASGLEIVLHFDLDRVRVAHVRMAFSSAWTAED